MKDTIIADTDAKPIQKFDNLFAPSSGMDGETYIKRKRGFSVSDMSGILYSRSFILHIEVNELRDGMGSLRLCVILLLYTRPIE